MKKILAVDMALQTGWAYWTGGHPISGTQSFRLQYGESLGMVFLRFEGWLTRTFTVETVPPDLLVYEAAHHRGGAPTQIGVGMVTILLKFCAEHNIEHCPCHSQTLKKYFTGKGNASKGEMMEAAAARWNKWGLCPADDNEADALALLAWGLDGCPKPAIRQKKRCCTA